MVTFWRKKKKKEAAEVKTVDVGEEEFSYSVDDPPEVQDDLVDVGDADESDDIEGEDEDEDAPWALESLDVGGYWDRRFATLQATIDARLWKARAVGGDREIRAKGMKDLSYVELIDKAESMFIELRCALVTTAEAPKVISLSNNALKALKVKVGTKLYPTAVLGMIQSCLHEQQMGFHTIEGSIWDFDEDMVNVEYKRALQNLQVVGDVLEAVEEAEAKELSEEEDAKD